MKRPNLLLQTDSYKLTHFRQLPPGTERMYSYLESRGGMFNSTVFFGLQYYLQKYLSGPVFDMNDIYEADKFAKAHFGRDDCFNASGWTRMYERYHGRLPVEIKAVPEGTSVPVNNVLMTIENTDPEFPWLTNYLETMLMKIWYPTTICTLSNEIRRVITKFIVDTGGDPAQVAFKCHDFGYRGVSSEETAAIGAAAHLVNFQGTDTLAGIIMLSQYYGAQRMTGFSVPAAEHSTITSWGRENEEAAYRNMLDQFPTGIVAVVSDSYNLQEAISHIWGDILRDKVLGRQGTLVIRPDSGDPRTIVLDALRILGEKFQSDVNHKGYRVLPSCVRLIQGDGISFTTIPHIYTGVQRAGWACENVGFGSGGALLQQVNRDTQRFALKCAWAQVNGEGRDVSKDPVTDHTKRSKGGRLVLVRTNDGFTTVQAKPHLQIEDSLVLVFKDGVMMQEWSIDGIRNLVNQHTAAAVAA